MDEIRTVALAAVAEVSATHDEQGSVIRATKIVRDKTGCRLHDAVDAVKWAIDHPPADSLPVNSIVATPADAYIKQQGRERSPEPWSVTGDSGWHYSDDEITDMIQRGEATVLRTGTGQ